MILRAQIIGATYLGRPNSTMIAEPVIPQAIEGPPTRRRMIAGGTLNLIADQMIAEDKATSRLTTIAVTSADRRTIA